MVVCWKERRSQSFERLGPFLRLNSVPLCTCFLFSAFLSASSRSVVAFLSRQSVGPVVFPAVAVSGSCFSLAFGVPG